MDDNITSTIQSIARKLVLVKGNKRLRAKDRDKLTQILSDDIPVVQDYIKRVKSLL